MRALAQAWLAHSWAEAEQTTASAARSDSKRFMVGGMGRAAKKPPGQHDAGPIEWLLFVYASERSARNVHARPSSCRSPQRCHCSGCAYLVSLCPFSWRWEVLRLPPANGSVPAPMGG